MSKRQVDRLAALVAVTDAARRADQARLAAITAHVTALRRSAVALRRAGVGHRVPSSGGDMIATAAYQRVCEDRARDAERAAAQIEAETAALRARLALSFGRAEAAQSLHTAARRVVTRAADAREEREAAECAQSVSYTVPSSSDGIA